MLEKFASYTRSLARNGLAIAFWAHALGLFKLIPVGVEKSILRWSVGALSHAHLGATEAVILAVILFYSLIAENGWASLFYDVCFILLFPFSRLFTLTWPGVKWSFRRMFPELRKGQTNENNPNRSSKKLSKAGFNFQQIGKYLLNPVQRFSFLWCILIIFGTNHIVELVALIALILAIIAVARNLLFLFDDSDEWEWEMKRDYQEFATNYLAELTKVGNDARKRLPHLLAFLCILILMSFVASERWLRILTRTVLFAVLFPYYEYLSVLLSFVYFEVAKIQHIPWQWLDALIASLFMPATFGLIPSGSKALLIIGGIHTVFAVVVGVEILLKGARAKAERLRVVFKELVGGEDTQRINAYVQESQKIAAPAVENPNVITPTANLQAPTEGS